jgi:hypothetical protein
MAYYLGIYRGNVIDVNIERNVLLASHFLSRPEQSDVGVSPRKPSRKITAVRSVKKGIRVYTSALQPFDSEMSVSV